MRIEYDSDFELLKFNLERFLNLCKQAQNQTTTSGLRLKDVNGTFEGFSLKATFGSGNLIKRPGLTFLRDGNEVNNGIYPILVFIPEYKEIILCKGVSYDNKTNNLWKITTDDKPLSDTKYADEKGKYSYYRSSYLINDINDEIIKKIQHDIKEIIKDYLASYGISPIN